MMLIRSGFHSDELYLGWWDLWRLAFGKTLHAKYALVIRRGTPRQ